MVSESTIYVREVVLDDLKHNKAAHETVNGAYRSEGNTFFFRSSFLFIPIKEKKMTVLSNNI